jgi:hypothetical protein
VRTLPVRISDDEHFVKYCKQKDLIRENGVPIGVQPWAFALRRPTPEFPDPEKTLSGVYYEFFEGTPDEKMCASYHFISLEIKKKDALIRMQAGAVRAQGQRRSRTLRLMHDPDPSCLAYAQLLGLPFDTDDELCGYLANEAISELVPASAYV